TLKMPAFEWVHVQLHQQKGMISLSPPTICNSAKKVGYMLLVSVHYKPSWLSTKNRQLNLHFLPWPAVCAPTFLPCSGSIKKKTSMMQITTFTN
ncbi:hypothetical protein, partial [Klebsiella pneumoniae]